MPSSPKKLSSSWWLLGAALLLLSPLWRWALQYETYSKFQPLKPDTPLSHVNGELADQWRFLEAGRHAVLPGSSYTVRAADSDTEMSLFMMSIGLCTRRDAHPSSYFGGQRPEEGGKAKYVLAYRDFTGGEAGLKKVVGVVNGSVYERAGR